MTSKALITISRSSTHLMKWGGKIVERNAEANRSRILAGYCWNWPKAGRTDANVHEIQIGNFEMSWNLEGDEAFALSPTSINEAGCIHTTRGLEFEYVGIIIGDGLRYEDGHLVTDYKKRARTDRSVKGLKKLERKMPVVHGSWPTR